LLTASVEKRQENGATDDRPADITMCTYFMGERYTLRYLVRKPAVKKPLEYTGVHGRIILKWIIKK